MPKSRYFILTFNQDALSSSPPLLLSSLSATTALPPPLLPPSLLLPLPSTRPQLLPPLRLSPFTRALLHPSLPTPPPTAPPRSLLPLLLALVPLQNPPLEPLLSRVLLLLLPPLVLVSSPSSVSSPLCKRLELEYANHHDQTFTTQKGIDMPDFQPNSRLVSLTFPFLFPH